MRDLNLTAALPVAIAGVLASAAASAANFDLYVSGASALRAFWAADMGTSICGATSPLLTYVITGISPVTDNPDNVAYRCTAAAFTTLPAGFTAGDQVTMHYSAELGSVWGINPFLAGHRTTRLFVDPDSADCVSQVCTIASYDVSNEAFTSTNGTAMAAHTPDVGVTDMEPSLWFLAQNWPTYTAFGTAPSKATLLSLQSSYAVVNGQVFSAIVNTAGPLATGGNISRASLQAIATGKYDVWGDVPEVGGGNTTQIVLCRRDQGSGTQVANSVFLTGFECGRSTTSISTSASPGALGSADVIENGTTGKVRTCVQANAGAIGFTSLSVSPSLWATLRVDGVQANAHNAASGAYTYAYEDWMIDRSATTQGAPITTLVSTLRGNARRASGLLSQVEAGAVITTSGSTGMAGSWFAATPRSNYAVAGPAFGNSKTVAAWAVTSGSATTALQYRSGDNCKLTINDNLN